MVEHSDHIRSRSARNIPWGGGFPKSSARNRRVADGRRLLARIAVAGVSRVQVMTFDDATDSPTDQAYETLDVVSAALPGYLDVCDQYRLSLIVRIYGGATVAPPGFLMIDDCSPSERARYAPLAFFTAETSPENYQVWLLLDGVTALEADRYRERFFDRARVAGERANPGSSGALRFPGSRNFKPSHGPVFPVVNLLGSPGRTVTPPELDALGLLAPPRPAPVLTLVHRDQGNEPTAFPDYKACLAAVGLNSKRTGPDRSNADLEWCKRAFDSGHRSRRTMAAELEKLSTKALEHKSGSHAYALGKIEASAKYWRMVDELTE